ncbi:MAG: hypothetical protein ACR2JR_11880 [Rubrobacteraceae bacterium]
MMAAEVRAEAGAAVHVHHGAARCLLSLYDRAAEGSVRQLPAADHRRLHRDVGDFARWGRRGGLRTLAVYGRPYFSLLARFRWGRVEVEALMSYKEAIR